MKRNSGRIERVRRHSAISDEQSGHSVCEPAVEPRPNLVARSEDYTGWSPVIVSMSGSAGERHKFAEVFIPPICAKRNPTEWEETSHRDLDKRRMIITSFFKMGAGLASLLLAAAFAAPPAQDIVDTAVSAGSFNTLVAAVKAAGLVDTLKGPGPFTVFAPTDEAFAKLPAGTVVELLKPENKSKLVAILTYHVVPGKVMAKDVVKLHEAKTVNGPEPTVMTEMGSVMVNNANVVKTDILCTNGVIHVIDTVVLPQQPQPSLRH